MARDSYVWCDTCHYTSDNMHCGKKTDLQTTKSETKLTRQQIMMEQCMLNAGPSAPPLSIHCANSSGAHYFGVTALILLARGSSLDVRF